MYEELRNMQLKELQILKEVDRICSKNNLQYFMAFGTLIGAIREKGFIPWDDDLDIGMRYKDYLKFIDVCKTELSKGFFLQNLETDINCNIDYSKLRLDNTTLILNDFADYDMHHGIAIDIYPYVNMPDSILEEKLQSFWLALYLILRVGRVPRNHGIIQKIICGFILSIIRGGFRKKIVRFCLDRITSYEAINTERIRFMYGNSVVLKTYKFPSRCFKETIRVKFEDGMFCAPIGYDEYLKCLFGDYMTPPPESEQGIKLPHIKLIDCERSYIDYKGIEYCINIGNK